MTFLRLSFIFFSFFAVTLKAQQSGGSLPGGLVFPMLPSAALTNAAALTTDWLLKAQVLYSPGLNDSEPQSYLAGFSKASDKFGFNIGYSGSTHREASIHNAFGALATKIGSVSIGFSARKLDLMSDNPIALDFSLIWNIRRTLRIGIVSYDFLDSKQTAVGIGIGRPYSFTLGVDALLPSSFTKEAISTEYALRSAITFYLGPVGFSAGAQYSHTPYEDYENNLSGNAGVLIKFSKTWSIIALGSSTPRAFSIGLTWSDLPTTQQYIHFFQKKNQGQTGSGKR